MVFILLIITVIILIKIIFSPSPPTPPIPIHPKTEDAIGSKILAYIFFAILILACFGNSH